MSVVSSLSFHSRGGFSRHAIETPFQQHYPSNDALSMTATTRRKAIFNSVSVVSSLVLVSPNSAIATTPDISNYIDGERGLKYLVTKEGNPDKPKAERAQKVKASYILTLNGFKEDGGKEVDSSKGLFGDKPLEFFVGVSQVIKGWDLAVMDMREGEYRKLVIPPSLGYGDEGAGGDIPGGATLYFEVGLVEIGKMGKMGPEQVKW
eukprot:CAMPEP_0195520686 /NCGR_PEP_ID=MMETSP0794_2-20130614/17426_1 /TAXON_ID=515487 /ORGANISM="Stephanopyxis turris, Strain CCMP 815" /LENGTH=205 /DNA_ID=CAMNT_0040650097 /DNA_START=128 /DNA_END=742 /DNA_ORIENTATION=-